MKSFLILHINKIKILFSIFFVIAIILSVSNRNGFLIGHSGFAGPHMVSNILNKEKLKTEVLIDEIFYFNEKPFVSLYNHHPKLFFTISEFLINPYDTPLEILNQSYRIAFVFNLIGIILFVFYVYHKSKSNNLAIFVLLSFFGVYNITSFLELFNFDSLSILSTLLIYIFFDNFLKINKNRFLLIILIIFVLNISWYNHLFFYLIYLCKFLEIIFKNNNSIKIFISKSLIYLVPAISTSLYIVFDIYNTSIEFKDFELIGGIITKGFGSFTQNDISIGYFCQEIFKFIIKTSPVVLLYLCISKIKSISINENKFILIGVFISVLVFFIIDFKWNMIHQFLSIYIVSFFIIVFSTSITDYKIISNKILISQFVLSVTVFVIYNLQIENNNNLFDYAFLKKFEDKSKYLIVENNEESKNINDMVLPQEINGGQLRFLSSLKYFKGISNNIIKDSTVILKINKDFEKK